MNTKRKKTGRKLLSFLLTLALVVGLMPGMGMTAYAASETTVTYDLSVDGKSINKGGVTCKREFDSYNNNLMGGTFTTSNGKFTKIVVNAADTSMVGMNPMDMSPIEGWSSDHSSATWTGNSSSVQFGIIMGNSGNVTITFTIEPSVDVTGVSLNKNSTTLTVGDTVSFTATVEPNDATDKYVTWSSNSDALKLYADSSCTVALGTTTGVAAGQPIYAKGISLGGATVTATSRSNNDVTASCDVTVISNTYNVTYKVVNGTWSDGSTADKTETVANGGNPTNVPTGMVANSGYTGGSWDTDPLTATISADTTFTYKFVAASSPDSPDDGDNNPSSGSSDNNSSNNDSSNNNNSSNDSENSNSEPKDETPYDYLEPLRGELKAEIALGGERTVTWDQGTALPYDIMKTLQDNPGVTLIFSYTYQGIDYKVTISGKDAKAYTEIPWYGPLYLYNHYGTLSETAPADTADTAIGTRTYTVIPGDTLSEIATKLNTTVDSLVSLNDIKNRDFILVGQILKY